ncbi:uncharacterized protein N7473_003592 [Penicillium subrubescens]|uniref:Uncharacterized protein n=1 Tax=Penicillium subrubescens TaxID=1316194 RepID=A0A1Q5TLA7_9EURO|nr:uncharacterized protein N7473_003592 [Penicillium subrubescens]KAJ5906676.1 hypothetical protein N7473_003592 [Penicillium subrubescens]OKP01015.1 hypothetical protein PENSUB_7596 [Penicillium subrubescens]
MLAKLKLVVMTKGVASGQLVKVERALPAIRPVASVPYIPTTTLTPVVSTPVAPPSSQASPGSPETTDDDVEPPTSWGLRKL